MDVTSISPRCHRHPAQPRSLRCDQCRRPYCRECLVSRFITSRSSIWLCRSCAAGWSGRDWGAVAGGGGSLARLLGRYWWAVAALALVALVSAGDAGRLLGA
jgi:hypothetical protein